jgi:hypothetical protein
MEADQIDVLAFAMLRDFQQIDQAKESRFSRKLGSDFLKADLVNGVDFDVAFFHAIAGTDLDVREFPDPDAADNFPTSDAVAKALGEDHGASLTDADGSRLSYGRDPEPS